MKIIIGRTISEVPARCIVLAFVSKKYEIFRIRLSFVGSEVICVRWEKRKKGARLKHAQFLFQLFSTCKYLKNRQAFHGRWKIMTPFVCVYLFHRSQSVYRELPRAPLKISSAAYRTILTSWYRKNQRKGTCVFKFILGTSGLFLPLYSTTTISIRILIEAVEICYTIFGNLKSNYSRRPTGW